MVPEFPGCMRPSRGKVEICKDKSRKIRRPKVVDYESYITYLLMSPNSIFESNFRLLSGQEHEAQQVEKSKSARICHRKSEICSCGIIKYLLHVKNRLPAAHLNMPGGC